MPAFRNWLESVGSPEDPVATDVSSRWSMISLLKAVYKAINDGTFAANILGQGQTILSATQGTALRAVNYLKLTRVAKVAAEAAAASASASATSTAADALTTAAQAGLATEAADRVMGMALITNRAKKAQRSATASASAAAASAASITAESLVLGVQVYS